MAGPAGVLEAMRSMLETRTPETLSMLGQLVQKKPEDPFRVLISTILSHRTRDERTEQATRQLFEVYDSADALARAPVRQVEHLIRPVGFYRVKARRIREVAHLLLQRFNGQVPSSYDALLTLPAVGPKTANCVLVYAFGRPAIPVDTHVHRVANRLGLVATKTPEATEAALRRTVPRRYWLALNELFVRFGQTICKPLRPDCPHCTLRAVCPYYRNMARSRAMPRSGSTPAPSAPVPARPARGRTRPRDPRSVAGTWVPI